MKKSKIKKSNKFNIGTGMAWLDATKYYYSTVATTILLWGVLKINDYNWLTIIIVIAGIMVIVCVIGKLHMKFIYPKHSEFMYNNNPVIQEFRKEFAKINKQNETT